MELTKSDFSIIRNYVRNACGIDLSDDKDYLVHQRLESVAQSLRCANFFEFSRMLQACPDAAVLDLVVAAITTNETSFFRDEHPFEMFRSTILPELCRLVQERKSRSYNRKGAKVSILCAGASTGQEPYSLSILIHEHLQFYSPNSVEASDFSIVATDISSRVLAKAVDGEYSDMEMGRGLTDTQKNIYFTKKGTLWVVKNQIKDLVEFRRVNFVEPFIYLGGFDVIFCRNMLIYFNNETKQSILNQFYQILTNDGSLILGSTENVYTITDLFESKHVGGSVLYKKKIS